MTGPVRGARVAGVSIDCADHRALATFYARMLGGHVDWATDSAAGVTAGSYTLIAQRVSPYRKPVWPGSSVVHLDLTCRRDDLDAFAEHAQACGAVLAPEQFDDRWVVMLDPAGHPFCLTPIVSEDPPIGVGTAARNAPEPLSG